MLFGSGLFFLSAAVADSDNKKLRLEGSEIRCTPGPKSERGELVVGHLSVSVSEGAGNANLVACGDAIDISSEWSNTNDKKLVLSNKEGVHSTLGLSAGMRALRA